MDEQTLQRFKQALETAHGSLTKADFTKAFEVLLKLIIKNADKTSLDVEKIRQTLLALGEQVKGNTKVDTDKARKESLALIDKMMSKMMLEHEAMLAMCDKKMATMKDGRDGLDSTVPGPKGDKGDSIVGPKGEKGDVGPAGKDGASGGGGRASHAMKIYPLTPDGSTKIFSVPKSVASYIVMSDAPNTLFNGGGFTLNRTTTQCTLTVDVAPTIGSQLLYIYSEYMNT